MIRLNQDRKRCRTMDIIDILSGLGFALIGKTLVDIVVFLIYKIKEGIR